MFCSWCVGNDAGQSIDEIDSLRIPRSSGKTSLEVVRVDAPFGDEREDASALDAAPAPHYAVPLVSVLAREDPKLNLGSASSICTGSKDPTKSGKSLNFDQHRDEIEIDVAENRDESTTEEIGGDELRKKFGGRSATSRDFKQASTWSLDVRDIVDPSGGLRRKDSVFVAKGDIHSKYKVEGKLGEGSFGTVMKVSNYETREVCALKIIPVENLKETQRFEQELDISRRLKHPHIIVLYETYMEGDAYHLIMEMCQGGDLYDRIMSRPNKTANNIIGLSWQLVAVYAWQMITGLAYLHHYCFVHRDIKPENYLLSTAREDATIKLIDFGLARECKKGDKMMSRVGTPHYVAPEVVSDAATGYGPNCDCWSIGVTLWFIAIGTLPFMGKDQNAVLKAVVRAKYDFSSNLWNLHGHPQELKQLIGSLLERNNEVRPSAKDVVKNNAWLKQHSTLVITRTTPQCCSIV